MKKICIVTTVSITMKSFVLETAKHLHNECGYDVTLICNNDDEFAKALPEYIHYIPVKMVRGVSLSGFGSVRELTKIFKREKFDLVQYSTPNASMYASLASKKAKVPVRLYCQWGIRYVGLGGISRKIFKFLEKQVCKNSTHIRAVSPMNMSFAISEGLYSQEKARVVGNGGTIGVDTSVYDINSKPVWRDQIRLQYGIDKEDFVFGFAGRISADKGCGELLSSFKSICQANSRAKLFVVGPCEEKCGILPELLDWAKKSPSVIFTDKVENARMREFYSAMDVLVHPTYREGFGMVIQEAGALGVPTVTTRIPGASEVMQEGISCLLVEPKNDVALESAMLELLNDKQITATLSNGAYERVCNLYNRPIMLANQQKDYERLLKKEEELERVVLSDKIISNFDYPIDTNVKRASIDDLDKYNGNEKVVAICGSRAMAIKCAKMNLPSLKLFQLTSAGFDGVPCDEYAKKGVIVANAGSVYSAPIAETVVFGILQMAKKLRKNPNNRHFKLIRGYNTITELDGKNVLIMGAGNIGTSVADRLLGFGVTVDGYDPYCQDKPQYRSIIRTRQELKTQLYKYDYIVSTLPDNEATRGFINKELFDCMKKTAVIVNVGRKAVFNNSDFYMALKTRTIGGAVLDMFEKLPNPITNKFRRLKNVIVLPGVSAISKEVNVRLKEHMYANVIRVLKGEPVLNAINEVK